MTTGETPSPPGVRHSASLSTVDMTRPRDVREFDQPAHCLRCSMGPGARRKRRDTAEVAFSWGAAFGPNRSRVPPVVAVDYPRRTEFNECSTEYRPCPWRVGGRLYLERRHRNA